MGYQIDKLAVSGVDGMELRRRVDLLVQAQRVRYRRLWAYYRNPMRVCAVAAGEGAASDRPYRQAQEWGLPARITGVRAGCDPLAGGVVTDEGRKEVVVENDIAWRIDTQVDYLFGKPLVIAAAIDDEARREVVSRLLRLIVANNGGLVFLQQLALLGSVYGFVDVLVKFEPGVESERPHAAGTVGTQDLRGAGAAAVQLGTVQPAADGSAEGRGVVEESRVEGGSAAAWDGAAPGESSAGSGTAGSTPAGGRSPASVGGDGGQALRESSGQSDTGAGNETPRDGALARIARMVRFEIVEPARALPLLSAEDWRIVEGYVQVYEVERKGKGAKPQALDGRSSWWERVLGRVGGVVVPSSEMVRVVEVITGRGWQRYEDEKLVAEGGNSLGVLPLAHVQNVAVPFEYAGISDVEPLIPLQDELNTRLSDRAHRISMQSFKMYLGRGIPNFESMHVGPGRLILADDTEGNIQAFGGDEGCPSEESHMEDLREAMDKASGVSPIAAGAIKGSIGRLTSAAALRVTMQSLLAKTEKKRTTYGAALQRMLELALTWLDVAGVFKTSPEERGVELHWPSPIPENDLERLQEAEAKLKIGVRPEIVLRELGY